MEFKLETAVHPALRNIIRQFWQVNRRNGKLIKEKIIPKGSVEIIFNLHDDSNTIPGVIGDRHFAVPRCFISGFNTVPIHLQLPRHQLFFGVYMNPTSLPKIFRIHGKDYANQCADLTLLDASMHSLWHQLAEQKTFTERITVFTSWMMKRLPEISKHEKMFDNFLTSSLDRSLSADDLSKMLCYSPRHLSRKLYALTAMNVEQTLVFKRYNRAIDLMHHSSLLLTEIAHSCDFSDQSHFTKTFKSFAGMKPTEYRAAKSHVSGHIFDVVR
jgi:AraC-like DNA-binding protein